MPQWTNQEFEAQAAKIAQTFWAGAEQNGAPLNDLVTKTAKDNNLNPEQIERLCRRTNLLAYEQKFAALAKNPDRLVEFAVADDVTVINSLTPKTGAVEKTASYPELTSEYETPLPVKVQPLSEKLAAIEFALGGPELPLHTQLVRLSKIEYELGIKVAQEKLRWDHAMEEILESSRRVTWDHDAFEKNALGLYPECLIEINALRTEKKLPPLVITNDKLAELTDHLIATNTPETLLIKKASDARENYLNYIAAKKLTTQKLAKIRSGLNG